MDEIVVTVYDDMGNNFKRKWKATAGKIDIIRWTIEDEDMLYILEGNIAGVKITPTKEAEFIGHLKTNDLDFGDYVEIEQLRHGAPNEMYIHKVINAIESNVWVDAPVQSPATESLHDSMEKVLSVIQCGVDETKVIRVREEDCKQIFI